MHVSHAIRMLIAYCKVLHSTLYLCASSAPTPRPPRPPRAAQNPAPCPYPACARFPATPGGVAGGGWSDPGRGRPPPTPGPNIPGRFAWGAHIGVLSRLTRPVRYANAPDRGVNLRALPPRASCPLGSGLKDGRIPHASEAVLVGSMACPERGFAAF